MTESSEVEANVVRVVALPPNHINAALIAEGRAKIREAAAAKATHTNAEADRISVVNDADDEWALVQYNGDGGETLRGYVKKTFLE